MFEEMMNDRVHLKKRTGKTFENIKSIVQERTITTSDIDIPFEEQDYLLQELPNGKTKTFIIEDINYINDPMTNGFGQMYTLKVKNVNSIPSSSYNQNTTYNFHGHNSRVNVNSQDYSTNIINSLTNMNLFEELYKVIQENIKEENEKQNLIQVVDEMKNEQGHNSFTEKYKNFMTLAANHMTVFSPFIPMLSQFLV